jgi:hypothetical protein
MMGTDRLKGIVQWLFVIGSFSIAFIQFVPSRLSDLLSAPKYIGYILSFQIVIIVILSISILYIILYINEIQKELEDEIDRSINYYISRIPSIELDEESDENENQDNEESELATDGENFRINPVAMTTEPPLMRVKPFTQKLDRDPIPLGVDFSLA